MTDKELLEKAARRFLVIAEDANRITSGNLPHDLTCLKGFALRAAESIERHLQEPVSEELEKASKEWLAPQLDKSYAAYGETKQMELTHFDGYAMLDAIEFGAKWGKNQAMAEIQAQSTALAHGCPEESESEDLEYASEKYACRFTSSKYGHNKVKDAFIAGAKWQKTKDESITEDLGEYVNELSKQFPEVSFAKLSRIAVRVAKWQKEQDQSTIELAEDHAMLADMNKMKQQMMTKAIVREVKVDAGGYPYIDATELYDYDKDMPLAKEGDKVKILVIKED